MKTKQLAILILLPLALLFEGCATTAQKNGAAFLSKVASLDITAADVSQSTSTPFYSHSESISGLSWNSSGFDIVNLKASFAVPLWGCSWSFTATSIKGTKTSALQAPLALGSGSVLAATPK